MIDYINVFLAYIDFRCLFSESKVSDNHIANTDSVYCACLCMQSTSLTAFDDDNYEADISERREMEQLIKCRMASLDLSFSEYSNNRSSITISVGLT